MKRLAARLIFTLLLLCGAMSAAAETWVAVIRDFQDDLWPEPSSFDQREGYPDILQSRLLMSQFDAEYPERDFWVRMIAIARGPGSWDKSATERDFAVILAQSPEKKVDRYRILWIELPVPSYWYSELFEHRMTPLGPWNPYRVPDASRRASLDEYSSLRPGVGRDDDQTRAMVNQIEQRLATSAVQKCEIKLDDALARQLGRIWRDVIGRSHYTPFGKGRWLSEEELRAQPQNPPISENYRFNFSTVNGFAGSAGGTLVPGTRPELLVTSGLAMRDYCKTKDKRYLAVLKEKLDTLDKRIPVESRSAE